METTNKVKIVGLNDHPLTDLNQFMQPPITTMEEFNRVLHSEVGEDGDYWDETFSDDWDDDLARPDDFPITCMISNREKNIHYFFQVTNKALNDHCDSVTATLEPPSEDKHNSAIAYFDFDRFIKEWTR